MSRTDAECGHWSGIPKGGQAIQRWHTPGAIRFIAGDPTNYEGIDRASVDAGVVHLFEASVSHHPDSQRVIASS
jgi:hypothetical protein